MSNLHPVMQQVVNSWIPKFKVTYCSQCGGEFGPGNHGYSHCTDHKAQSAWRDQQRIAFKLQLQQQWNES